MSTPLEDYALIGDCETAALVSRHGSIDWLCWPRFDSHACFAALLGGPEHGRWIIEPINPRARCEHRYRDHTLILETTFEDSDGAVTVIDFMPPRGHNSDVVRLVRGDRGRMRMRMELILRFDCGLSIPWVTRLPDGSLRAIAGPNMAVLRTPVQVRGKDLTTVAEFDVAAGDSIPFVLTYGPSHVPPPDHIDPDAALKDTVTFWTEWGSRNKSTGEWAEPVMGCAALPTPGNRWPCRWPTAFASSRWTSAAAARATGIRSGATTRPNMSAISRRWSTTST